MANKESYKARRKERYKAKAQDSFKTKLALFLFYSVVSKKGFLKEEFKNFEIENAEIKKGVELVKLYSTKYYQYLGTDTIDEVGLKVDQIFKTIGDIEEDKAVDIDELRKEYLSEFENKWPFEDFEKFAFGSDKCCDYCRINLKKIQVLLEKEMLFKKANRGYSLEIDRKDSNLEYSPENCVLACYWCNNAKTDEFTYKEFKKEVGPAIAKVWQKRLLNDPQ